LPKGLVEYIGEGSPSEVETGRNNLTTIERYLKDLERLCGCKAVGENYRRDFSGIDSENRLAELFCEIALCACLGNPVRKTSITPSYWKGNIF